MIDLGALTFKPQTFNSRPWEVHQVEVPDFLHEGSLVAHLRGQELVKLSSTRWLRDRVRFSYDGYRRQRLVRPLIKGRTTSLGEALQRWFRLSYLRRVQLYLDPCQPYAGWITNLYRRWSWLTPDGQVHSIDHNRRSRCYLGGYGLEACQTSTVSLPLKIPYEEFGLLRGPSPSSFSLGVWLQFLRPAKFVLSELTPPRQRSNDLRRWACLQVSPLQRLLEG